LVIEAGRPFVIEGHRIEIGASIGIAMAPLHGVDPDELLQNADIALYRAKAEGRGRSVVFRSELAESMRERCQLDQALRTALANDELDLYYQPIVDLGTGRVTSCEALMRWRHPERGMIPPGIFIPLAEDIGLIGEIGEWSLMRACRDAATWPEEVKVAVNLSAVQFASGSLVDAVQLALRSSGLVPQRLVLEVTETLLLEDDARTIDMLNQIEGMEVSIALDDFGTGYASLSYLRSFPFDKIKIDQTFVRDIEHREDCVAIVRAVTSLAHTLGMRTVAEGVETVEHLEKVAGAGCDEVQGYLFSRPVPASEIGAVIQSCGGRNRRAA
jgi:predicted signal transduction protein with EAL and GGDEF domain